MLALQFPGRLANIMRQVSVPYLPLSEGLGQGLNDASRIELDASKNLALASYLQIFQVALPQWPPGWPKNPNLVSDQFIPYTDPFL